MITDEEFLDIIENHLSISPDGSIQIVDDDAAQKYEEYIREKAAKGGMMPKGSTNPGCTNVIACGD